MNNDQDRNLEAPQVIQCGLLIQKGFWSTDCFQGMPKNNENSKETLRNKLDLDTDLPRALVVRGGDGMGGIVSVATALGQKLGGGFSSPAYQMMVVCGLSMVLMSK